MFDVTVAPRIRGPPGVTWGDMSHVEDMLPYSRVHSKYRYMVQASCQNVKRSPGLTASHCFSSMEGFSAMMFPSTVPMYSFMLVLASLCSCSSPLLSLRSLRRSAGSR